MKKVCSIALMFAMFFGMVFTAPAFADRYDRYHRNENTRNMVKKAAIGAAVGGAIGGIASRNENLTGGVVKGALLGGALGAGVGYAQNRGYIGSRNPYIGNRYYDRYDRRVYDPYYSRANYGWYPGNGYYRTNSGSWYRY